MTHSEGALSGLRVLDLTRVLAGPFCTMMMADMGAEVIKIEEAGKGDDTRQMGPFQNGESAYYMNLNRNKKGVTLNLKHPRGKELFLGLVRRADIVVENYRPGTMEKLGLGYEDLRAVNPRIIYAAISGFGHTGRYRMRPGYDIISQAMSGLMSTTGWPGGEPTRTGTAMGDVLGGLSAAIGILAAVHSRGRTGLGQKVDVALVDSCVASLEIINMIYLVEGRVPARIGNRYESTYPYDSFRAKDGSLVIGTANDKLWRSLCGAMERPDLAEDPRFLTVKDRVAHHAELKPLIEEWTTTLTVDEVYAKVDGAGVPCAPILSIDQVVADPHIAGDREMFVPVSHPKAGETVITGSHIKLSDTPPKVRTPSPALGEHNASVFGELLGLSDAELAALADDGAI
ncbi:CoA transferase [Aminiphilus sp.]|jgi:crotonobetainyl-CoA:carnitine CoA-transferase CaiB-like acyl-CoA transferase|uniref:CaiB/BaiF CoA transferase family protein n=1 Tax=Aminiphilus sp. TaxID=1872488 RepID=UPI0026276147|nr:CoA transferase [Aminiphilus sp.]